MMLHTISKHLFLLSMLVAGSIFAPAQSIAKISFKEMLGNMPKLPADWQQAQGLYANLPYGESPAVVKRAMDELEITKKEILKPLFERFQSNSAQLKTAKAFFAGLSREEQIMLRDFQTLDASWLQGGFEIFSSWIENRPGITKQSWTKIKTPLGAGANVYYQQLLQLENQLKGLPFLEQAREREGILLPVPKIQALNEQMSKELEKVPLKKIKVFEGSDATAEVADPQKSIEVLLKWKTKTQQAYQQTYSEQSLWWYKYFEVVTGAAKQLDGMLAATSDGASLAAGDRQLLPVIADMQERIVNMIWHLLYVEKNIAGLIPMSEMSRQTAEQAIGQLKKVQAQ